MEKLKMHTVNKVDENVERIAKLFPNCITEAVVEDKLSKVVDFDLLKQELSSFVVEGNEERYQFTWPDKKKSILLANAPIAKTLRPCLEESVEFDNTENLYIEGDNLEALKLLQETYLGKVKMIYIDPPYNTGKDFVYGDDFSQNTKEYLDNSGQYDEEGNRLFQNNESNGRFHTDWLNMMYPRIKIAKDLLTDDGVIFISIDDNEVGNLRNICDEVFNQKNLICQAIWDLGTGTTAGHFTRSHEYILVYAKNKDFVPNFKAISDENIVHGALKKISRANPATEITFPVGFPFEGSNAVFKGVLGNSEQEFILSEKMEFKDGKLIEPTTIKAGWGMANQVRDWIAGRETFDSKGQKVVGFYFNKQGILFYEKERGTYNPKTVLSGIANTKNGSSELTSLFNFKPFDFPKPTELLKYLSLLVTDEDSIILDFFSGSASTAHAVMQLNAEDGGNRKYIMVQLPEVIEEKSEAYKAGYKNLCEIGKERIRRAGTKIKDEAGLTTQNLDTGFRVLKVDSTNMKDVFYKPEEFIPTLFDDLTDNIKEDRTPLDLLFQVMLEMDVLLSSKIVETEISSKKVYSVMDDYMIACFDKGITSEVVEAIAKREPYYAVFRDSCMADDSTMESFEQIFETYSKDTIRKVL